LGAFAAMLNLILLFCIMMIVVLIVLTDREIAKAKTDVLFAIADKLFPRPWSYLAVLATLLSTVGTIETQILQFSRSVFAMARDDMLPPRLAGIHAKWRTPWAATLAIWFSGVLLLLGFSYMPSVNMIMQCSIDAISFQICFYMSLTGFACAWHYRKELKGGAYNAVSYVLWPLSAALFMVFIAIYSIPTLDRITNIVGIGGIVIGFVPLLLAGSMRAHRTGVS
jgi:amino acid transporter